MDNSRQMTVNKKIASTRWVFAVKYGTDGRIDRFQARLVVRGFEQAAGHNFDSTFAPVLRFESLQMLFAIEALHGMSKSICFRNCREDESTSPSQLRKLLNVGIYHPHPCKNDPHCLDFPP